MPRDRALRAMRTSRVFRRGYLPLVVGAAAGVAFLAHAAPLNYDEAFNRLNYSRFGVITILRTYDFPNNHLPFTVLQSLIPAALLRWNPWTVRIFGVVAGVAMVACVVGVAARRGTTPYLGLLAIGGSPILVSYLFLARGYTFSAVFLSAGVALPVALRRRAPLWGVVFGATALAVGTWPLPIYLYSAPGWVLAVLAVLGLRAAVIGAVVYAAEVTLAFAPIAGQLRAQSKIAWAGSPLMVVMDGRPLRSRKYRARLPRSHRHPYCVGRRPRPAD